MSVRTALLDMVDFIGISLDCKNLVFTGKGLLTTDWGLCKQTFKQMVFSSFHDETTGETFLLLAQIGDLGLVIDFDPRTKHVQVAVVDRSLIPERGKGLWNFPSARAIDDIPPKAIRLVVNGPIKGPLTSSAQETSV